MSDDLVALLISHNRRVVFVPNTGNAGDSFIAHATYQLFERLGLAYEVGHVSEVYPDRTIVCGGGGNLVEEYRVLAEFVRRNAASCHELILLPHTVRAHSDVLGMLGANCFVFCREVPSFKFVKAVAGQSNVLLAHDMALNWDPKETRREFKSTTFYGWPQPLDRWIAAEKLRRHRNWALSCVGGKKAMGGVLNAFRTDVEKTGIALPADNFDVSAMFADNKMAPKDVLLTTARMMSFLSGFDVVRTNRLHVAIMSAILGREVEFFDNSYGKNQAVYEHSMRDRFTTVRWFGRESLPTCG